jgi:hypothetical protein
MARGGLGLTKVLLRPAMPNPSTPCGQAGQPAAVYYPFGHPTLYANVWRQGKENKTSQWPWSRAAVGSEGGLGEGGRSRGRECGPGERNGARK